MIDDMKKLLPKLDRIAGITNLKLKVYGSVKKIEDLEINKNAFCKGIVYIKDNEISIGETDINKTNAEIKLDGSSASADINAYIDNSPLKITAKIKNDMADVAVDIPKLNLNNLIEDEFVKRKRVLPEISLNAKYRGNADKIEFEKLRFEKCLIITRAESRWTIIN